jgi:hypothetical protein
VASALQVRRHNEGADKRNKLGGDEDLKQKEGNRAIFRMKKEVMPGKRIERGYV